MPAIAVVPAGQDRCDWGVRGSHRRGTPGRLTVTTAASREGTFGAASRAGWACDARTYGSPQPDYDGTKDVLDGGGGGEWALVRRPPPDRLGSRSIPMEQSKDETSAETSTKSGWLSGAR
uniref:Uncharacterized protein n=1 Tax=Anopheles melas TaxID=34690 RepID=A0A182TJW0_9DIPT